MSQERGGRGPTNVELAERDRLAKAQAKAVVDQLHADLRALLPQAAFQRYAQHLMAKCGTFDCVEVLTAEAYRNQARRAVGVEVCKEFGDADRKAASEMMARMMFSTLEPE